ncbi:hypothetical protein E4J89_03095 [Arthrobacter sp. CAU 1506]|uniref:hypothetical protein n=1 Tax=Arthrobacter sp. CAU 1506 TaxID=2560052 RepID=UPI0010AC4565|nr:hypothetical protein [Arthrobacter sp. CAU 1506]TJY71268.1 hypothetical protein E4J89_03095 [Arthrobacter sp. CAU 1506]
MRWDALFEDLEAQLHAADRLELEAEVNERARIELAAVDLANRLRGQLGTQLRVSVGNQLGFDGALSHVGSTWLVLNEGSRNVLVPLAAVQLIEGMGRHAAAEVSAARRLGLGSALRGLGRDRAAIGVYLAGSSGTVAAEGVIDRVGADSFDLAAVPSGEDRRAANVRSVLTVPFTAIAALVSRRLT